MTQSSFHIVGALVVVLVISIHAHDHHSGGGSHHSSSDSGHHHHGGEGSDHHHHHHHGGGSHYSSSDYGSSGSSYSGSSGGGGGGIGLGQLLFGGLFRRPSYYPSYYGYGNYNRGYQSQGYCRSAQFVDYVGRVPRYYCDCPPYPPNYQWYQCVPMANYVYGK